MRELELNIYKKIGVRQFRNILVKFLYFLVVPLYIIFKIPKSERKNLFHNSPSNYFMKKGNGLKDLKDFKKWLYFNAAIHVHALIRCIIGLFNGTLIIQIPFIILNLYCIMLQRYNYIRIDNTIKKYEEIEKTKINNFKENIREKIEEPHINVYTRKNKENETLDSVLDDLSLKNLKALKNLIETKQICKTKFLYTTINQENKNYEIRAKVKAKKI